MILRLRFAKHSIVQTEYDPALTLTVLGVIQQSCCLDEVVNHTDLYCHG